ncbi:MAG: YigZ family protein [Bacteroidales bacterium]|nr:YigZ family protein [Bacteroidales bacterium]
MSIKDTYNSVSSRSEGLYKELGSRFISFVFPVETKEQIKEIVSSLRNEYHDARHHCYAFRLGLDGSDWRASDDGEPSGTAGRPILAAIDSAGLSDVLVVVVRYFGGIKLGVPGLIRAYREAASDALAKAEVTTKVAGYWYRVEYDYSLMPQVMKIIKDMNLPQRSQNFAQTCSLELRVRLTDEQDYLERTGKLINFINEKLVP